MEIRCPRCNDMFHDWSYESACPRCGLRLVNLLHLEWLTEAGTVTSDRACVGCEYNLKTLHISANCPECGTAVHKTLWRNELGLAGTAWLTQVRSGVGLLALSFSVVLIEQVGGYLLSRLGFFGWATLAWYSLGMVVATTCLAVGSFRISRVDATQGAGTARWRVRLLCPTAITYLAASITTDVYPLLSYIFIHGWRGLFVAEFLDISMAARGNVLMCLHVVSSLIWCGSWFLAVLRLRDLAQQTECAKTRRAARFMVYFVCPYLIVQLLPILLVLATLLSLTVSAVFGMLYGSFYCLEMLAGVVALLLIARACMLLRGELRAVLILRRDRLTGSDHGAVTALGVPAAPPRG